MSFNDRVTGRLDGNLDAHERNMWALESLIVYALFVRYPQARIFRGRIQLK